MIQCLNPICISNNPNFLNPDEGKFCLKCGKLLLLNNRYLATEILGRGGFGRTFKAIDDNKPSKPVCVIKQFLPDPESVNTAGALKKAQALFEQEAISLDNLGNHSQIPELLAYFTIENCQYLVQEFISGQNLQQELDQKGVFNQQKIRDLLLDLLPVLKFVHENKVIHRDIKPENIIRNDQGKLVIVDFGAAKQATETALGKIATKIGSAEYVSNEQIQGRPIFASDIYSLGVSCIYLLTQISPFDLFDNHEGEWIWRNYLHNNPVDDHLGAVLDKMIQQYVKPRYQSVDEVLEALNPQPINITSSTSSGTGILPISPPPSTNTGNIGTNTGNIKTNTGNQMPVPQSNPIPKPPQKQIIQPQSPQLKTFSFETTYLEKKTRKIPKTKQVETSSGFLGFGKKVETKTYYEEQIYYQTKSVNLQAKYYIENLDNNINLDMISIPGGSFMMGSSERQDETPIHKVTVKPFFLAKYPITQSQWRVIANRNDLKVKIDLDPDPSSFKGDQRPVEKVNWYEAVEFCDRLSKLTGRQYKLPGEAQWEYACRAGTQTRSRYYFGDDESKLKDYAWYNDNSNKQTHPVGQKKPNNFGLYDMHGNVWEWCEDNWHINYNGAPNDGSAWSIKKDSQYALLRGGAWCLNCDYSRSAFRFNGYYGRDPHDNFIGFRVVGVVIVRT